MYCITCEKEVSLVEVLEDWSDAHFLGWTDTEIIDFCIGPFATCPPPDIPDDWELYQVEPELEFMEVCDE